MWEAGEPLSRLSGFATNGPSVSGRIGDMELGLRGRKAIVCASSRGLGKACALALAREGACVIINGRDEAALYAARDEIAAIGAEATAVAADVSTRQGEDVMIADCTQPVIPVQHNCGPTVSEFC